MGYELHITRAKTSGESDVDPITIDEWLAYVASDDELRLVGHAEVACPDGVVLRVESDGLSVWMEYSCHAMDGSMAWFDWRSGRVAVKNPDLEVIEKMKRIASALGAHVIGDEGESY